MAEARMSRKELKEPDKFQAWLYGLYNTLYQRRLAVAGAVAAVVLAAGAAALVDHQRGLSAQSVADQFYDAHQAFANAGEDPAARAVALSKLRAFAEAHPESTQAAAARVFMGEIEASRGEFAAAAEHFKAAADSPAALPAQKAAATLSAATALENLGQADQALALVESVALAEWADIKLKFKARAATARGDQAAACGFYKELRDLTPASPFKGEAEGRISAMTQCQ